MTTGNNWYSKQTADDNGIKEYTVYDGTGKVIAGYLGFKGAQEIVHYANQHSAMIGALEKLQQLTDPSIGRYTMEKINNIARRAIEDASETPWARRQHRGKDDEDSYRVLGIDFPTFYVEDHAWCPTCGERCDAQVAQGQVFEFCCYDCGRTRNQKAERALERIAERRRSTGR